MQIAFKSIVICYSIQSNPIRYTIKHSPTTYVFVTLHISMQSIHICLLLLLLLLFIFMFGSRQIEKFNCRLLVLLFNKRPVWSIISFVFYDAEFHTFKKNMLEVIERIRWYKKRICILRIFKCKWLASE